MSDHDSMVSTTAIGVIAQTPENTTPPFEAIPNQPPKPKRKRVRLTPAMRAKKIAEGWNPPGPRPGQAPVSGQAGDYGTQIIPHEGIDLLRALVEKLVALENNEQYRSIWLHFFTHGGVYSGPNYLSELQDACNYLNGMVVGAQTSVGDKS